MGVLNKFKIQVVTLVSMEVYIYNPVMFMYGNCLPISFLKVPIYHVPTILQFFFILINAS